MIDFDEEIRQIEFDKKRVADLFETDYQTRLNELTDMKIGINNLSTMRKEWTINLSTSDSHESNLFENRLTTLRVRMDILYSQLRKDISNLVGNYERQTLSYLIEATKPTEKKIYDDVKYLMDSKKNSSIGKHRLVGHDYKMVSNEFEIQKQALIQKNMSALKDYLKASLETRLKILSGMKDLKIQLDRYKREFEISYSQIAQQMVEKLTQFIAISKHKESSLMETFLVFANDYLVLRHNSRIFQGNYLNKAHQRIQNELYLKSQFEEFTARIESDRKCISESSNQEIDLTVEEMHKEMFELENHFQSEKSRIQIIETKYKQEIRKIRQECDEFDRNYNELQRKRVYELNSMNEEMKKIRVMIKHIYTKSATEWA